MANASGSFNGAVITPSSSTYSHRKWHCNLAWSRTDYATYSAITITVTFVSDAGGDWGQVGKFLRATGWISGTQGINFTGASWACRGGADYVCGSYTKNVTRTTSAQSVAISGSTWLTSSSAYDGGTSTASGTVTVPALASYTVSFNANGGTGTTASQTKYYGVNLALRANGFSKSGYSFMGWGTSSSTTAVSYSNGGTYTGNASITLYAIWRKTITITYNANGGTGAPAAHSGYAYNSATSTSITLSGTVPTRAGYTTDGWATSSGGEKVYNKSTAYTFSSSQTLYAHWNIVTYNLTYDLDGGTVATDNPSTYTVESSDITLIKPTKSWYRFAGWTGTGITSPDINHVIPTGSVGDRAFTATWERPYVAPTVNILVAKRDSLSHTGDDSGEVAYVQFEWTIGHDEETEGTVFDVIPQTYTVTFIDQDDPTSIQTSTKSTLDAQDQPRTTIGDWHDTVTLIPEKTYDVYVTLNLDGQHDHESVTSARDYISNAHFIIDINPDGTAIGFGTTVNDTDDGVYSAMDLHAMNDIILYIDETQAAGTIDGDLYDALDALGWI